MLSWLKYCLSMIGRAVLTIAVLVVAVAFGIAVQHQFGGSFWVVVCGTIAFLLFVVLPLRVAFILHRSKALERNRSQ